MSRECEKLAQYIVACVNEFANEKNIDRRASFRYLYNNSGIKFLTDHYDIEHTLSMHEAIEDLTLVCQKNGGSIQ